MKRLEKSKHSSPRLQPDPPQNSKESSAPNNLNLFYLFKPFKPMSGRLKRQP